MYILYVEPNSGKKELFYESVAKDKERLYLMSDISHNRIQLSKRKNPLGPEINL